MTRIPIPILPPFQRGWWIKNNRAKNQNKMLNMVPFMGKQFCGKGDIFDVKERFVFFVC